MKILVSGLTRKTYAVRILVFLMVKHKNKQIIITVVRISINNLNVRLFGSKHVRFYGTSGNTIAVPDLLSLIID